MPRTKKFKAEHPIDTSGVLEAAKFGQWPAFYAALEQHHADGTLTYEHFNELPPGRTYGVVHQIAFYQYRPALERLLQLHPRVNLKLPTRDGQSAVDVAVQRGGGGASPFVAYLRRRLLVQTHHELVNKARDGQWPAFFAQLLTADTTTTTTTGPAGDNNKNSTPVLDVATVNSVPAGRIWGILHQVCYWGDVNVLERLAAIYPPDAVGGGGGLEYELETNEAEAAQRPIDICRGRGHEAFVQALRAKIDARKASTPLAKVTAPSSTMKVPVPAAGHECQICFSSEYDNPDLMAVCCDNDHYMCAECFSQWVNTQSDIDDNPQSILLNGGRITCVCTKSSGCDSAAYANKLIATLVTDELYEKYLRARDYVVGKEAVSVALAKLKNAAAGDMDAVEKEQIRNMYRTGDGTYSAYMCQSCKFGPIDHGWCNNLASHQGEVTGEGSVINNACPKCGWFAANISAWPRWDGTFQDGGRNR